MRYQPNEMTTTAVLSHYNEEHEGAPLIFTHPEGDSYLCTFDTSYDSDNGDEADELGLKEEEFSEALYRID